MGRSSREKKDTRRHGRQYSRSRSRSPSRHKERRRDYHERSKLSSSRHGKLQDRKGDSKHRKKHRHNNSNGGDSVEEISDINDAALWVEKESDTSELKPTLGEKLMVCIYKVQLISHTHRSLF